MSKTAHANWRLRLTNTKRATLWPIKPKSTNIIWESENFIRHKKSDWQKLIVLSARLMLPRLQLWNSFPITFSLTSTSEWSREPQKMREMNERDSIRLWVRIWTKFGWGETRCNFTSAVVSLRAGRLCTVAYKSKTRSITIQYNGVKTGCC